MTPIRKFGVVIFLIILSTFDMFPLKIIAKEETGTEKPKDASSNGGEKSENPKNMSMATTPPYVEDHGNGSDTIDTGIQLTPNVGMGRAMLDRAVAELEVTLYVGAPAYERMDKNEAKIRDYLELLVHAANVHFLEFTSPRIVIRMCGMYIFKKIEDMTFYEGIKEPGKFKSTKTEETLLAFGKWQTWVYENREKLPKCDAHVLLTTEMVNSWAILRGFCSNPEKDKQLKAASNAIMVADQIGLFTGARTLAHELGHALGADHDGESRSKNCSSEDGFIMRPFPKSEMPVKGFFKWSECSKTSMRRLFSSKQGECAFKKHCSVYYAPSVKVLTAWHNANTTVQCEALQVADSEKDDTTKTELKNFNFIGSNDEYYETNKLGKCDFLQCYHTKRSSNTYSAGTMARHGTICGKGKRCNSQKCVGGTFKFPDFSEMKMVAPARTARPKNPTMTQQCATVLGDEYLSVNDDNEEGVKHYTPDEMCESIRCKKLADKPTESKTHPKLKAPDGTPCDNGKVCRKQKCVK